MGEEGESGGRELGRMADPATDRLQLHHACQGRQHALLSTNLIARGYLRFLVKQTKTVRTVM